MTRPRERRIPAARFKAECLAFLDEVETTGRALIVTKRGRPVARVAPVSEGAADLRGSVVAQGEIVSPLDEHWDAETSSSSTPARGTRR
jgi:prevent-host-death family protein